MQRPPTLVHITDGGLLDNTGVMQLMRRREERILLAYGGNDPKDAETYRLTRSSMPFFCRAVFGISAIEFAALQLGGGGGGGLMMRCPLL